MDYIRELVFCHLFCDVSKALDDFLIFYKFDMGFRGLICHLFWPAAFLLDDLFADLGFRM